MADYFTHFSCLLDVGTPDNAARALDLYNKLSEDGASEEPPSEGFLLSIQPEHGGSQLWMRDDVTGEPLIQRDDDMADTVRRRLDIYHNQTKPLIAYYNQWFSTGDAKAPKFVRIDGVGSVDQIKQRVCAALG